MSQEATSYRYMCDICRGSWGRGAGSFLDMYLLEHYDRNNAKRLSQRQPHYSSLLSAQSRAPRSIVSRFAHPRSLAPRAPPQSRAPRLLLEGSRFALPFPRMWHVPARMSYPPAPNRRRLSSPPRVMPDRFIQYPSAANTQDYVPLPSLSTADVTDR